MRTCCVATCIILAIFLHATNGQVPPRLSIPGAVLLGGQPKSFRQARLLQQPEPPARLRRPSLTNTIPLPIRDIKPVIEEPEDQQQAISDFDDEVNKLGINALQNAVRQSIASEEQEDPLPRPVPFRPERPVPVLRENIRENLPQRPPPPLRQESRPSPVLRQEVPQRPIFRQDIRPPPRQEVREENYPVRPPQPIRQVQPVRQPAPAPQVYKPANRVNLSPRQYEDGEEAPRARKPVVQILRKYRTDNEDGSITWGFENEDGTFKEETLGTDCITRGKYGYVDPDGVKREYAYETGNKCDEADLEELEDLPPGKQPAPQPRKLSPQFRPAPAQY